MAAERILSMAELLCAQSGHSRVPCVGSAMVRCHSQSGIGEWHFLLSMNESYRPTSDIQRAILVILISVTIGIAHLIRTRGRRRSPSGPYRTLTSRLAPASFGRHQLQANCAVQRAAFSNRRLTNWLNCPTRRCRLDSCRLQPRILKPRPFRGKRDTQEPSGSAS